MFQAHDIPILFLYAGIVHFSVHVVWIRFDTIHVFRFRFYTGVDGNLVHQYIQCHNFRSTWLNWNHWKQIVSARNWVLPRMFWNLVHLGKWMLKQNCISYTYALERCPQFFGKAGISRTFSKPFVLGTHYTTFMSFHFYKFRWLWENEIQNH